MLLATRYETLPDLLSFIDEMNREIKIQLYLVFLLIKSCRELHYVTFLQIFNRIKAIELKGLCRRRLPCSALRRGMCPWGASSSVEEGYNNQSSKMQCNHTSR